MQCASRVHGSARARAQQCEPPEGSHVQVDEILRAPHLTRLDRSTTKHHPFAPRGPHHLTRASNPIPPPQCRTSTNPRFILLHHPPQDNFEPHSCALKSVDESAFQGEGEARGEGGVEGD